MRKLVIIIVVLLAPWLLQANVNGMLSIDGMKKEKRVALVIGNNNYKSLSPLKNPINDAKALKKILEKRGFEVMYESNIKKSNMRKVVKEFSEKLKNSGVGLFFFAGHGVQVDGRNYLIASDSTFANDDADAIEYEAVALNYVLKKMKRAKNRLNIVILDACRNNPFGNRGSSGGLASVSNARGMFIAYATEAGGVTKDGRSGSNGIFTKYLVKNMQVEGLSIEEVFKRVRRDVHRATNGEQSPGVYNQILGDFYFTLPKNLRAAFQLSIETKPKSANVEIVNIGKKYSQNMKLKRGVYNIKVSKSGYVSKEGDIDLQNNLSIRIVLDEATRIVTVPKNDLGKWNKKIFRGKRSYSKVKGGKVVKDNYTKLLWQKSDDGKKRSWKDALSYCRTLSLGGFKDWKLPSFNELYYLADRSKFKPAIDKKFFKTKNSSYWTATEYKNDLSRAWHVFFDDGGDFYNRKTNKVYVRCVRASK